MLFSEAGDQHHRLYYYKAEGFVRCSFTIPPSHLRLRINLQNLLPGIVKLIPDTDIDEAGEKDELPKFAIIGQPNVGKLSL